MSLIAVIVFPISLSIWGLAQGQGRTALSDRIGVFMSEEFLSLLFTLSLLFVLGSGIVLGLHSWKILLVVFAATAVVYPLIGRRLALEILRVVTGPLVRRP